jgi:hypothetical protein
MKIKTLTYKLQPYNNSTMQNFSITKILHSSFNNLKNFVNILTKKLYNLKNHNK